MKICAAQLRPVIGDLSKNIDKHLELVELAIDNDADSVFFPELSLTGYEPSLAISLARKAADFCLDEIQYLSDTNNLVVGIGMPFDADSGVQIGMLWLQPNAPRRAYAKQLLHADEAPYFVTGDGQIFIDSAGFKLAPAICYESLQMSRADNAASLEAKIYLASVAESSRNLDKAMKHYATVARRHNMHVIMADLLGPSGDFVSVGQSAAWNASGDLLGQMDAESEGIILLDTDRETVSIHKIKHS